MLHPIPRSSLMAVRPRIACLGALCVMALGASQPAAAQGCEPWTYEDPALSSPHDGLITIEPSYPFGASLLPGKGDHWGSAIDLRGGHVVVGAPRYDQLDADDNELTDSGGYLDLTYTADGQGSPWRAFWDGAYYPGHVMGLQAGSQLGYSVAIQPAWEVSAQSKWGLYEGLHSFCAAGAPGWAGGRGMVLMSVTWTGGYDCDPFLVGYDRLRMMVEAPDGVAGDRLGESVALGGDLLFAGAPRHDESGVDSGAVYVFRLLDQLDPIYGLQCVLEAKISLPAGSQYARFGQTLAYDEGTLLVGAPNQGAGQGAVYAFRQDAGGAWVQEVELSAVGGQVGDRFGAALSMHDGLAVIGAPFDDDLGTSSGSAFAYRRSASGSWSSLGKLHQPGGGANARFGTAVDVHEERIVVGAPFAQDADSQNVGNAYVFSFAPGWGKFGKPSWLLDAELGPGSLNSSFGSAVAIEGVRVAVGANRDDRVNATPYQGGGLKNCGATYFFVLSLWPLGWPPSDVLHPQSASTVTGLPVTISVSTSPSMAYQWRKDGQVLSDNGVISGTTTSALVIAPATEADEGRYDVEVWNAEAESLGHCVARVISTPADLVVNDTPPMPTAFALRPGGGAGDGAGSAVAVEGDVAIVGAPGAGNSGPSSGVASIYRRSGLAWTLEAELVPADGVAGDLFGAAVDIEGDRAVVGAPGHDSQADDAGAVYVFERSGTTWTETAKLAVLSGKAGDAFGTAVALRGRLLAVGAPFVNPNQQGCAYLLKEKDGVWDLDAVLPGDGDYAQLGSSVALVDHGYRKSLDAGWWYEPGGIVVAGAPGSSGGGYVGLLHSTTSFVQAWSCEQVLTGAGVEPGDAFGASLAIEDGVLLVGSPGDDDRGVDAGAAYVFRWQEGNSPGFVAETKLTAYNGASGDGFGGSVAAEGDLVLIGARGTDGVFTDAGSAYLFLHITDSPPEWFPRAHVLLDAGASDGLGSSVGLDAGTILVGIPGDDNLGADSGSAAFYDL